MIDYFLHKRDDIMESYILEIVLFMKNYLFFLVAEIKHFFQDLTLYFEQPLSFLLLSLTEIHIQLEAYF